MNVLMTETKAELSATKNQLVELMAFLKETLGGNPEAAIALQEIEDRGRTKTAC